MEWHDSYHRDTYVEVDLDALSENIHNFKQILPDDMNVMAIVKANGYGHGAFEVATEAISSGATMLGVAFLDEALFLRKKGIEVPILVLGAVRPSDVQLAAEYQIDITILDEVWLGKAAEYPLTKPVNLHLKIDSGMGRLGIRSLEQLEVVGNLFKDNKLFVLNGIYTHFAAADELNTAYYEKQLQAFEKLKNEAIKKIGQPKYVDCGNSAATLRFSQKDFNVVRVGIAMYGLTPSEDIVNVLPFLLKPVMSLHSQLVAVKKVEKGDCVSYGCTYTAQGPEWIGTVPIGYADGYRRTLQGQSVLINGERAEIVGRICMDQLMVRLPHEMKVGEKVTLIGAQGENKISVEEIANCIGTINYEVTCMMASRLPRIFLKNKSIIKVENSLS